MACASTVSAAAVAACVAPGVAHTKSRTSVVSGSKGLVLPSSPSKSFSSMVVANKSRVTMSATQKEHDFTGLTGLALLAAAVVPEIAEAAQPGISPSLKNLLLSVVAGGVVLAVITVAVAGVSTFDPVKRK
ncbi:unnamed protein product [Sphagnum compactum]|jgi:hypothetical protein